MGFATVAMRSGIGIEAVGPIEKPVFHSLDVGKGDLRGRIVEKITQTSHIRFERIFLRKDEAPRRDLRGSVSLTEDKNHKGWLHIIIYVFQLINAIVTFKNFKNINLVHGQIILGVNEKEGRKGQLLLAHALCPGIKTSSEDHQKDEGITGVVIYRPTDEKLRNLIAQFAEQTAVNFQKIGLDMKDKDFKLKSKKLVGQFAVAEGLRTIFYHQVFKSNKEAQKELGYVVADLLKGDLLRDKKGELSAYFCTAYSIVISQGASLIWGLSEEEKESLKAKPRDEIAKYIAGRIDKPKEKDQLSKIYWDNDFMQLDARLTMSYLAGDVYDRASDIATAV